MQEGIIQIGSIVSQGSGFLESLVSKVDTEKKGRQRYILRFCFSTTEKKVVLDTTMQLNQDSSKEFLFIGGAPGANSPQWYSTATNSFYHITETIPNLCKMDFGSSWNNKLQYIKDSYFIDLGEQLTSNKNRYAFDFSNLPGCDFHIKEVYETNKTLPLKETKAFLKKELLNQLKNNVEKDSNLKLNDIGLFTILIDGEPFCNSAEYRTAVVKEKEGKLKTEPAKALNKLEQASCYSCGSKKQLRDDINIEIKSYTTNLHGFGSNTNKKNYQKNLVLCQNCLSDYLAGEKFVKNRLNLRLAKFQVYMYPHFILGQPPNKSILEKQCDLIRNSFNAITNFDDVALFRERLDRIGKIQKQDSYYMLNLIFYKQNQKATKIQRFIQDVAPSRFSVIAQALNKANSFLGNLYNKGAVRQKLLNLKMIYYLFPIREDSSGEVVQYRNLLNLYDAIFTGKTVSRKYIMDSFMKANRIVFYQQEGYNIKTNSKDTLQLEYLGLTQFAFIKFLHELGIWKGADSMNTDQLPVAGEIKQYLKEGDFTEEKAALFFLGCVIGQIGINQYKRTKTKPILKKLNFNGMDLGKVTKLGNTIEGKIYQEKMFGNSEIYIGLFQQLFTRNEAAWSLNKAENLFYLLSGYNYMTITAISNKERKGETENEK